MCIDLLREMPHFDVSLVIVDFKILPLILLFVLYQCFSRLIDKNYHLEHNGVRASIEALK